MSRLEENRERLLELIRPLQRCAVAFSAGVDSTVVAKAACLAVGDRAVAVTGTSASLASGELDEARQLAALIGIRHLVIETQEFDRPDYLRNAPDRCYHCKTELYSRLDELAGQVGFDVVLNGANADDLSDYRPGMKAATEHKIRSPLAELGMTKSDVRELAAYWQLPVWDKPASPCLSSRVAYGEEVTPARLAMIDQAERTLKQLGFHDVRVRYHKGDLARLEVAADEVALACQSPLRETITGQLTALGFKFVTIDMQGFRSGSLNSLVQLSPVAKS